MKGKSFLLFLFCLILLQSNLFAQTTIKGLITDTAGMPIPFVIVVAQQINNNILVKHTIADEKGNFTINLPKINVDEITLEFSAVNYLKKLKKVILSPKNIFLSISLQASFNNLDSIVVKSDMSIKMNGDTTFFRVDSFKNGLERNLNELLIKIPGFDVKKNGKITYNGKIISKVLLDNDDLNGNDYETLTKNFNIRSLDELQVIDNYKDADNITTWLANRGTEMALNLKIKKEFTGKIFGDGQIGLGLPENYKLNLQAVSLLKNFKSFSINNLNNTGQASIADNATQSNLLEYSSNYINTITQPELLTNSNIYTLQEVNQFQDILYIQGNQSAFSTSNFSSKLSKKIQVKGKLEIFNDNIHTSSNTSNKFLPPFSTLTINNNKAEKRNTLRQNHQIFLNYHTATNQLGLLFNFNNISNRLDENGELANKKYESLWNGENKKIFFKIFYAQILNSTSFLTSDVQFSNQSNNGGFIVNQNFLDTILFAGLNNNFLNQNEKGTFSCVTTNLIYTKKFKKNVFSVKLTNEFLTKNASNIISFGSNPNNLQSLAKDSLNNYLFKQNNSVLSFNNIFKLNKTFILNTDIFFLKRSSSYSNQKSFVTNNIKLLAQIGVTYKVNKKSQFYINSRINNKTQWLNNIGSGYEIKNISEFDKAVDSIIWKNEYYIQTGFNYVDLINKKFLFFTSFTINNTPIIFIPRPIINGNSTKNIYTITNKSLTSYLANLSFQKFSTNRKLKLSYSFSFNKIIAYNELNFLETNKIKNYFYNNDLRLNAKINKDISIEYRINHTISTQKISANTSNSFSPKQILNSTNFQYQISKNFKFFIDGNHLTAIIQKNSVSTIFLLNSSLSYDNQKIDFGLSVNNIFNNTSITQSMLSNINYSTTQTYLQNRVALVFVNFKF